MTARVRLEIQITVVLKKLHAYPFLWNLDSWSTMVDEQVSQSISNTISEFRQTTVTEIDKQGDKW